MNTVAFKTPPDVCISVAENMRALRKKKKLTIRELSLRSGVPYSTVKRFEHTGEISLFSLARLAFVLDCAEGLEKLFIRDEIHSIEDIINGEV